MGRLAVVAVASVALLASSIGLTARAQTPDRLAFTNDWQQLKVVGAAGGDHRMIAVYGDDDLVEDKRISSPSWSPDGTRVAYSRVHAVTFQTVETQIRTVRADGTGDRLVVGLPGAGMIDSVRWSPDGKRLAFGLWTWNWPATVATWTAVGSHWSLYVVNADGSGLRPVATAPALGAGSPEWSPDGKRLAFVGDSDDVVTAVYSVSVDGVPLLTRLSPIAQWAHNPRWSPDGTRVAFTAGSLKPGDGVPNAPEVVWVANADGSHARDLGAETFDAPSWSPDGRWLAYACRSGCGIGVISSDGRVSRILTTNSAHDYRPVWSRHGEIAFTHGAYECCQSTLTVMNGDGTNRHAVAEFVDPEYAWSG